MINFAQYTPDQPALDNPGTDYVKNVIPRTATPNGGTTYAPLSNVESVSDVLGDGLLKGAFSARDNAGNVINFAADNSDIYELSGVTWNSVSKSAGAYAVGGDERVEFVQFGDRVIASMGLTDPLQTFLASSASAFSDLNASAAPTAKHIAVVNNFVMAGNTSDSVDGAVKNRVWWSAFGNPTDWPVIGSSDAAQKQSDFNDIPTGGAVQKIIGAVGGTDGAIFLEKAVYRIVYEGPPTVFGFYEIERDRGAYAENSVVNIGTRAFYLDETGFFMFDGSNSQAIGDARVDKTFFADLDETYIGRVFGAADSINKVVYWLYPSINAVNGAPDKIIMYNWAIDRWSTADLAIQFLYGGLSPGYTLEELDAFGTLDTLPFSLDARAWTGGSRLLSGFDATGRLVRFSGAALEAEIETPETTGGGGARFYVDGIRPYVDGGTVTIQLRYRESPGGTLTEGAFEPVETDGKSRFAISTRYARARVKIAAGGTWQHAQGVDVAFNPDGAL